MAKKKTWIEKRDADKKPVVKVLEKKFADIEEGDRMLIATPTIFDAYVKNIPEGTGTELSTIRKDLAIEYNADKTCPVTTGIFLRIVSEAAYEELNTGKSMEEITPFWRAVDPKSKLAAKLECGIEFLQKQREVEGIYG